MLLVASARLCGLSKLERAGIVKRVILAAEREHGRWEVADVGGGKSVRIRTIDAGLGWSAGITTRFSGLGDERIEPASYEEALLLQSAPPFEDDLVMDVYDEVHGKVLSIGVSGGVDRIIGMTPGPWEAMFGLEPRSWPAAVERRLARSRGRRVSAA